MPVTISGNGIISGVAAGGIPAGVVTPINSAIRVYGGNGNGSSINTNRRFSTVDYIVGTDITYADSATNGASFTINTSGLYAITFNATTNSAAHVGITKNQAAAWSSVGQAAVTLAMDSCAQADYGASVSWIGYLTAGDVIRAHAGAAPNGTTTSGTSFSITRIA